jgi:hypothetical protein
MLLAERGMPFSLVPAPVAPLAWLINPRQIAPLKTLDFFPQKNYPCDQFLRNPYSHECSPMICSLSDSE